MAADLIIYLIIVLALLVWLRNTMGTRHEDEPQRPNPLAPQAEDNSENVHIVSPEESREEAEDKLDNTVKGVGNVDISNEAAQKGLLEIANTDKSFDPKTFATGAQDAFVIIVEAFAKGDRDTLKPLLQDDVYKAFEQVISEREERGETQETEIQAIRKMDITNAWMKGKMAFITLRITAEEVSYTKDSDGEVIAGDPDRLYDITDRWTFGRDTGSRDPVWYLYETNDDEEEEHDSVNIPEARHEH